MLVVRPSKDGKQAALVMNILKMSNLRVRETYYSMLHLGFDPRNSFPWLLSVNYFGKLLDLERSQIPKNLYDEEFTENSSVPKHVWPSAFKKKRIISGLTHPTPLVAFNTGRILYKLLENVKAWLEQNWVKKIFLKKKHLRTSFFQNFIISNF